MDEKTFTTIVTRSAAMAETSSVGVLRDLSQQTLQEISKKKSGVFIISGVRGSGKTTLLSRLYKEEENSIYVNAELILKESVELLDLLHYAQAKGHQMFLLDEIHALPNWEKDLKIFYDETHGKIVASGSSAVALKVKGSELSRRAQFHDIKPLSFREYLQFKTGKQFQTIDLHDIIQTSKRKVLEKKILPHLNYFSIYTQFDALPAAFFEKNKDVYMNILERTIRYDLMYLREIDTTYVDNVFRAIKRIATSSPGELTYSGLASDLGVGIRIAREMIYALAQTGIVYTIPPKGTGGKAIRKEEKILMPLSFRSALCAYYGIKPPKGSVREDFFIQHVGPCTYLKTGIERRTPDFVVGDYVFEVGGPSKGYEQIKKHENAFLVKESFPAGKKELPLYLFGFLY